MIKAADSKELGKALSSHLEETNEQVTRLEQVFELLGEKAKAEKCPAIEGIIKEADELMKEIKDPDTRDAASDRCGPGCAEHYEITRYRNARLVGKLLGKKDAVALLSATLREEYAARRQARPRLPKASSTRGCIVSSACAHGRNASKRSTRGLDRRPSRTRGRGCFVWAPDAIQVAPVGRSPLMPSSSIDTALIRSKNRAAALQIELGNGQAGRRGRNDAISAFKLHLHQGERAFSSFDPDYAAGGARCGRWIAPAS